jgi:hypothetical protein
MDFIHWNQWRRCLGWWRSFRSLLQLSFYLDHYEWQFLPVAGQTYTESGSAPCVSVEGDWEMNHYLPLLLAS